LLSVDKTIDISQHSDTLMCLLPTTATGWHETAIKNHN